MASFLAVPKQTKQWASDSKKVFSDSELEGEQDSTPSLKVLFRDLLSAYRENIKSWWEVETIDNYIKASIVPKGLRINISPARRSKSDTLLKKWEKELTESSLRLMRILLEEEKLIYTSTSTKLEELIEQTLKLKSDPDFSRREVTLQNSVEKYQTSLKTRKHNQYVRDLSEFKDNKAYQFLTTKDTEVSSSDVENSDIEPSGRTYYNNYQYTTRGWGRGRGGGGRRQWGRGKGRGRWQSPAGQGYTERNMPNHPNQTLPIQQGVVTIPPSSPSSSSSSSSFLEGGGAPPSYGLRERPKGK